MDRSANPDTTAPVRPSDARLSRLASLPGLLIVLFALLLALLAPQAHAASLTTTFAGGNGNEGVRFDLDVLDFRGIEVTGLEMNLHNAAGESTEVALWTRPGTSAGKADSPKGWALQGEVTVTSVGPGNPTPVPISFVLPGGLHGVVVGTLDGSSVAYTNGDETFEDAVLRLISGHGLNAPLLSEGSDNERPRIFNGTIEYEVRAPAIDSGPDGLTNDPKPTFGFSAGGDPVSFECRIYPKGGAAPAFSPCSGPGNTDTPAAPLADGGYAFEVRSVDAIPTVSLAARREFTVDTRAPSIVVFAGPDGPTAERLPTFRFTSDDPAARFECRLYVQGAPPPPFLPCSGAGGSDTSAVPLADASYLFQARAIDQAGNVGAPGSRSFTVDGGCAATVAAMRQARTQAAAARRKLSRAQQVLKRARRSGKAPRVRRAKRRVARARSHARVAERLLGREQTKVESSCA